MIGLALLLAQAVASVPGDISFAATVDVRSAKVQSKGEASVRAWADPDGGSEARSSGSRTSRRFELQIDARIADPLAAARDATGGEPQR